MNKSEILTKKIYQLLVEDLSINEIETWIYQSYQTLESQISEDFLNDLLAFDYHSKYAKQEFILLTDHYINQADFEFWRINRILDIIIHKKERFEEMIMSTYDLRCQGYYFLEEIGMGPALNMCASFGVEVETWDDLPEADKNIIIEGNYPVAKAVALQVKSWLAEKKIILSGKKSKDDHLYLYEDLRTENELSTKEKEWLKEKNS